MKEFGKNLLVFSITTFILLLIAEAVLRYKEGIPIFQSSIPIIAETPKNLEQKARKLSSRIISEDLDLTLYDINPLIREKLNCREEVKAIGSTLSKINTNQDLRIYNINYLQKAYCVQDSAFMKHNLKGYDDNWVYTYGSYDSGIHPAYTFFSNTSAYREDDKVQFYNFGWSGDPIRLDKPDKVIRIAFVGASTSQQMSDCNWAYPDYIGAWLNEWAKRQGIDVKFEIINAARVAHKSSDIAAIVKYELLPANPDLVIYYEGKNQLHLNKLITESHSNSQKEKDAFRTRSILLHSIRRLIDKHKYIEIDKTNNLYPKIPAQINAPNPYPYNKGLPINLPTIINDLDTIKHYLESIDSELILTSFAMMVDEDRKYNISQNQAIIQYWEYEYPNVSWKGIYELNQLQKRTLSQYAKMKKLNFIEVDELLTLEPDLFWDGIHLYCEGMKYKSWIILQDLLPIIKTKIDNKTLPKASKNTFAEHPFIKDNYDRISLDCNSISNYIESKKNLKQIE